MALYKFDGKRPEIDKTSFIHPQAAIIGDVHIGRNCYVGAGAVLRGDIGHIHIGDGSNIQDNAVIHVEPGSEAFIADNCLIGHASIVHGPCKIGQFAVVGMGAIVNDGGEIGEGSMLAAGSVLPPGRTIPAGQLAMGNPAKVVKDVHPQLLEYNKIGIRVYQELAARSLNSLELIVED